MNLNLTPAELKDLRWLLETVIADQEHFLDDETDPDARRDEGASLTRCRGQRIIDAPSERAQRGAEKLLKRLERRSPRASTRDPAELTRAQLARQDVVDNAIYRLLNELLPSGLTELPWCQSCLATVRYAVLTALREHAAISNAQFYPALGDPPSGQRIQVVSTRDANGDSELRLVPVLPTRNTARRQSGIDLVTLLNCAEADLFGYLEFIDVSAQDKEHSAAQTVRELHAALTRLQPQHTCPLSKWGGAP